jgi:hypothetical protein
MFDTNHQITPANDVIAASPGFALLVFAPPPTVKPSIQALTEFMNANSVPIVCWKISADGRARPITFGPPVDASVPCFVFGGNRVYQIDGPQWPNFDQWAHTMLQQKKASRDVRESTIPPGAVTVGPGEGVAFLRS